MYLLEKVWSPAAKNYLNRTSSDLDPVPLSAIGVQVLPYIVQKFYCPESGKKSGELSLVCFVNLSAPVF